VIGAPLVHAEQVYFGTSDSLSLHATQRSKRHAELGAFAARPHLRRAVAAQRPNLHRRLQRSVPGIDPADGTVLWRFETRGSQANRIQVYDDQDRWQDSFAVHGQTLIFASTDHHVYAMPLDCSEAD
jgi:outer membrane protein assembly factor BamB